MTERQEPITLREWLKDAGEIGAMPPLQLRDFLYCFDWGLDTVSQLIAIRGLLMRTEQADKELTVEIQQIEEHARNVSGTENQHAVDEWVDRLHHSVFQDAAHSMAAVGMLAPFVESVFCQGFRAIHRHYYPVAPPNHSHERWRATGAERWDCHYVITVKGKKKDVVSGIAQLAEACGLSRHLPPDLSITLSALFTYRNKMFHNGFEWAMDEREKFETMIEEKNWPENWFRKSTSAHGPWIFYMSEDFIGHCLATIDKVLDAFSEFVREELKKQPS
jgi:hypothetical protein